MTGKSFGRLDFNFHDSEIELVSLSRELRAAVLGFRAEGGLKKYVELREVVAFRAEDLVMQNVVSRVLALSDSSLSMNSLEFYLEWVTSLSDSSSWLAEDAAEKWRRDFAAGCLDMLVIEPSAGAQIAAIYSGGLIDLGDKFGWLH